MDDVTAAHAGAVADTGTADAAEAADTAETAGPAIAAGPARSARSAQPSQSTRPRAARPARPKAAREAAAELPFARILLDSDVSALGRPVDQLVPAALDAEARPGVRVRCRVEGELVDGYLIDRAAEPSMAGEAEWLQKVLSPVPVLTPEILDLARGVAERYVGTLIDVLRLAIPARSAAAEKRSAEEAPRPGFPRPVDPSPWGLYGGGREFIAALERKDAEKLPRALWTCVPGADWALEIATAMHATASPATVFVPRDPASPAHGSGPALRASSEADAVEVADVFREPPPSRDAGRRFGPDYDPDLDEGYAVDAEPDFDVNIDVDPGFDTDLDPRADADYAVDLDPDADLIPDPDPDGTDGYGGYGGHGRAGGAGSDPALDGEPVLVPGRGALAVVPDPADLARLDRALTRVAGPGHHVVLSEELGAAKRYQNWLAVLRGEVRMVIGTRAALFAPLADLGLVAVWDDGDARHAEPLPPYPHSREVLLLRAHQTGAAALVGGHSCTAEGAQLVAGGWARPLSAFRSTIRAKAPEVHAVGEEPDGDPLPVAASARLANLVWRTVYTALAEGPVLVQVPQGPDAPLLTCARCGKNARCTYCHGPLAAAPGQSLAHCGWCGRPAVGGWRCDGSLNDRPCGGDRFRLSAAEPHTAEELRRAFPGTKVIASGPKSVIAEIGPHPALILATPGAEPVAEGGYAAAALLDSWALLGAADLRAGEEALRRWLNAATLVRPADQGGIVVVDAPGAHAPVHALAIWDPVWHARHELEARGALHHAPTARVVELMGSPGAVAETLALLRPPGGVEVLGPVPVPAGTGAGIGSGAGGTAAAAAPNGSVAESGSETGGKADGGIGGVPDVELHRALIRVPRRLGGGLAAALRQTGDLRGVRGTEDAVRVRVDPGRIG